MNTITRQEAIVEMIDGAITACMRGQYACAITLAGAAEGAMPETENSKKFYNAAVIKLYTGAFNCTDKQADKILNAERNWLKHFDPGKPEQIVTDHAWFYVVRAYAMFKTTYNGAEETRKMRRLRRKIENDADPVFQWFRNLLSVGRRLAAEKAQTASGTIGTGS